MFFRIYRIPSVHRLRSSFIAPYFSHSSGVISRVYTGPGSRSCPFGTRIMNGSEYHILTAPFRMAAPAFECAPKSVIFARFPCLYSGLVCQRRTVTGVIDRCWVACVIRAIRFHKPFHCVNLFLPYLFQLETLLISGNPAILRRLLNSLRSIKTLKYLYVHSAIPYLNSYPILQDKAFLRLFVFTAPILTHPFKITLLVIVFLSLKIALTISAENSIGFILAHLLTPYK